MSGFSQVDAGSHKPLTLNERSQQGGWHSSSNFASHRGNANGSTNKNHHHPNNNDSRLTEAMGQIKTATKDLEELTKSGIVDQNDGIDSIKATLGKLFVEFAQLKTSHEAIKADLGEAKSERAAILMTQELIKAALAGINAGGVDDKSRAIISSAHHGIRTASLVAAAVPLDRVDIIKEPARSSIPVEKELKKKRKAELIVICEEHEVDHDGATVKVMIDRLLNNVKRTRLNE